MPGVIGVPVSVPVVNNAKPGGWILETTDQTTGDGPDDSNDFK